MFKRKANYVARLFMSEAAVAEAGGAGGGESAAVAAAPAAPAAAPAAPAPAPAPASVLAGGAAATPAPAPSAAAEAEFKFADKVIVQKDGATDWEATARQAEQARQHLERRMGAGDAPPAAATDYKTVVPEALAERIPVADLDASADFQSFKTAMHGAGLSQKQMEVVTSELLTRSMKLQEALPVLQAAECTAALKQIDGWKSDAEYNAQIGKAYTAAKAYGGANFDAILKDYGNDPRIVQLLAGVGAELAEDTQPSPEAQQQLQENLDTLQSSAAYLNANDPQHASVMAKVQALTAKLVGTKPVVGGKSMSFKT